MKSGVTPPVDKNQQTNEQLKAIEEALEKKKQALLLKQKRGKLTAEDLQEQKKIKNIEQELNDTKKLMEQNLEKLNNRGTKIQNLVTKTQVLKQDANNLKTAAVKMEQAEEVSRDKLYDVLFGIGGAAIGAGIIAYLGYGLALSLCAAVLSGLATYFASEFFFSVKEKVEDIEEEFNPASWLSLTYVQHKINGLFGKTSSPQASANRTPAKGYLPSFMAQSTIKAKPVSNNKIGQGPRLRVR